MLIVGATNKIKKRLEKLGIVELISPHNLMLDRLEALEQAKVLVDAKAITY